MQKNDGPMQPMLKKIIDNFSKHIKSYSEKDQEKILLAASFSADKHNTQLRKSGEPYFIHPIAVAKILIELNSDVDTVCAGLLHDTIEDTDTTYEDLTQIFGTTVADLVEGETKIASIKAKNKTVQESETIRKMFFAMSQDIRVLIVKLADKLHNMRTLEFLAPKRAKEIAAETLDIYAPLADRLGISWLKAELEDLSLKILKPDTYAYIVDYLSANKMGRSKYLNRVEKSILKACAAAKLSNVNVASREKHPYSIYMKMKKRQKELEEIYDILGVRILCDNINECYTILGVIHRLWPPIEGRFKDYIAMPKANNYQSLHTTVLSLDAKMLELQIRTKEMHETAEYGVAAHWSYKAATGSSSQRSKDNAKYAKVVEKLKAWSNELEQSESLLDDIKDELLKDTIYVFTPKGHTIELPSGATALDFAYHIHTDVGNRCVGAKADGSIIPLNRALKNTQVIEIITNANAKPNINWLRVAQTNSARKKIRTWLNRNDPSLTIDKNIIAKDKSIEAQLATKNEDEKVDNSQIIRQVSGQSASSVTVGKEKNLMISLAQCCNPVRGDNIVGYVSRGRGIIVHRENCTNLKNMPEIDKRAISVEWESSSTIHLAKFKILSKRTADLFSEIEGAVRKFKGHLIEGRLDDDDLGRLIGSFTMEVQNKEDSHKIVKNLRTIPNVISINLI